MKAVFLSFVLFVSALCGAATPFVNDDLKELLTVMDVPHDGTLQSMVEATQKRWIRPSDKERWQIKDTLTDTQRKAVLAYGAKIGFFNEVKPAHQDYDYAIVLGAAVSRMEKRIAYLVKMADSGVRFKQVILLSGARPLDPQVDRMIEGCKTEGDAMEHLWKLQTLSKQVAWKHFQHPMITSPEGKVRRPTTADTFHDWLANKPAPGLCFMVSDQPYCIYQQLIAESIVPQEFTYETIGPSAEPSAQNAAGLLDTVARCLYVIGKK